MKILYQGKTFDSTKPVQSTTSVAQTVAQAVVNMASIPDDPIDPDALTIDTVSTRFSIRLPKELALKVRTDIENYNNFFAALIQSYFEDRINRTEVYYVERS